MRVLLQCKNGPVRVRKSLLAREASAVGVWAWAELGRYVADSASRWMATQAMI